MTNKCCAPSEQVPSRMGRPRVHDRDQIAIELVEWAAKEDSINLCKFCCTRVPPIAPPKLTDWAKEDDNFREAYVIAKAFLGARREEWLNQDVLHVKAYDLNAPTYDYFLKDEKRQQMEFESGLKKEENNAVSPYQENIDSTHQLMMLKAELAAYKEKYGNQS